MYAPQISGVVPTALKGQLSDPILGINPRLVILAPLYKIDAPEIDFSDDSSNFLQVRIDPTALGQTGVLQFPFLTIDLLGLQDQREVKYSTFSGPIMGIVEVHHNWPDESAITDFPAEVNAMGDAILSCLNDASFQDWPGNLLWNGRTDMRPGPLKMVDELGWIKTTQFICPFKFTV